MSGYSGYVGNVLEPNLNECATLDTSKKGEFNLFTKAGIRDDLLTVDLDAMQSIKVTMNSEESQLYNELKLGVRERFARRHRRGDVAQHGWRPHVGTHARDYGYGPRRQMALRWHRRPGGFGGSKHRHDLGGRYLEPRQSFVGGFRAWNEAARDRPTDARALG